jgi:Zn-dependent protease with chaperone function
LRLAPDPDIQFASVNENKASRYHRLKRRAEMASVAWTAALLVALLASGLTIRIRTLAESAAPRSAGSIAGWLAGVIVYVVILSLLNEAGSLPIAFYSGFVIERRYGLSTERVAGWWRDQAKSFVIGLLLAGGATVILYAVIGWSPARWWLAGGLVFALLIVGLTNIAPVLVMPLFYRVTPLDRESLRTRLLALADRAGARVLGAYEWGLSDKTRKANAALTGLGGTRRILVSDTMLAQYSEDEIEVVLAHELAHHVHGDIWKGIVFESALIFGGFYLAGRLLQAAVAVIPLRGVADVAGLPLLLLAAGAVSLVAVPVAHAMSRAFERRADRYALDLTRNPAAFISAMHRLAAQNLAEDNPSRIVQWLFYSHPPVRERIAAARAFRA